MQPSKVFPGADEGTPSRSQYFSWINHTNEGPTEAQTRANLAFFAWLHEEYGLQLDIYAFDAGAVDGAKFYGSVDTERFHRQFPNGFGPLAEAAAEIGCRLGLWGGPDGFGETEEDAQKRIEMMVSLCRDHGFELFKMDGVCGVLRPEKREYFAKMMTACREHSPDLILLNHRLELGDAVEHATTFLLGGSETYIDVHMSNCTTASHNRACALERDLSPGLTRLTEDHGVCLSSCLDYWEDDLVLQAFNRCLILAPEIYGNPWLLRDDEYPRLVRLFNLHRRFREILVNGFVLPEEEFGQGAVSRGDDHTRLLTLRNLSWTPASCCIPLDGTIGLVDNGKPVQVRRFHPAERVYGEFEYGAKVEVEVPPFRSLLLAVSNVPLEEPSILGCDYEVVRDVPDRDLELRLIGEPGSTLQVTLPDGRTQSVDFPGSARSLPSHRKLGDLIPAEVPPDARSLYEATCFAADNNALEYRELLRSGSSAITAVEAARDAFFSQPLFRQRNLVDRSLFDDEPDTGFATNRRWGDMRVAGGAFRVDLGEAVQVDRLVLEIDSEYELQPLKSQEGVFAWVSSDLKEWRMVYGWTGSNMVFELDDQSPIRYVSIDGSPDRVKAVRGSYRGRSLDRSRWRASNLFAPWSLISVGQAWTLDFTLDEVPPNGTLAIAINGVHGVEGAYAALQVGDGFAGAARRAPSFPSNTWECPVRRTDRNTTYFVDLDETMVGVPLQAVVLGIGYRRWSWLDEQPNRLELHPEAWLTAYPDPRPSILVSLPR